MATTRRWLGSNSCEGLALSLFDQEELESAAAPTGPLCRVRMLVAYNGGPFRGFAAQERVKTVAGTMAEAVERVLGHPVQFTCAGRTDAGVHAWGQVVHFDSTRPPDELDLPGLQRALNKMLAPHIVVRGADIPPEGFDARRSAVSRRYRYMILNRDVPDPFVAALSWHVEPALDLRAMEAACDPLFGEHDFASFCRRPPDDGSLVRRVIDAGWVTVDDDLLRFEIAATSFCQQMVRAITGTLVEVGMGKKRAGDMAAILRARDRQAAGQLAPPHGLTLWEVAYPAESEAA